MIIELLKQVDYLHVLVATLAYFGLGAAWYMPQSPIGKIWMRESKVTMDDANGANMGKMFGITLAITFVICIGLDLVAMLGSMGGLGTTLQMTFFIWAAFSATTVGMNYLYQRKTFTLWAIDGAYQLSGMLIATTILTLWRGTGMPGMPGM